MDSFTEKIDALYAENLGAEAERLMLNALREAEGKLKCDSTGQWKDTAENKQILAQMLQMLNELIGYYRETGQAAFSYKYGEQAMQVLKWFGLEGSIPYATTLLNIANAYRAGGRLEDSLSTYEQVAVIYREKLEPTDVSWASFYNNISLLYQEMKRFDLAKESLLKALELVLTKPNTIFEQAVTYTNLANTCLELGQGEEACKYFTGAILLFEKHNIKDSHYCAAVASMGTFYYQSKQYEKALDCFEKAMAGIEASLGKNEHYRRMEENAKLCREAMGSAGAMARKVGVTESTGTPAEAEAQDRVLLPKKGLELCREYYETYGKPMLQKDFPQYVDKIAVGLVGEGSDCFGYDDGFSMDHDWGPRFFMWVSAETYAEIGKELEAAYRKLPKEMQGYTYKESRQAVNRQGVYVVEEFYGKLLGVDEFDVENICWENLAEERLAAATNGAVFTDEEGAFSRIRGFLSDGYPQWLKYTKMAESAARFSQAGQYNYSRMRKRGEKVSAQMMLWTAVKEALRLLYYAADKYPPHEKWLMRGLRDIAEYESVLNKLEILAETAPEAIFQRIEELAEELALLLYRKDVISDVEPYLEEHVGELLFKAQASDLSVEELAEEIAKAEFAAFDKVKNFGGRADCQDDWFTFSIMRKSQYYTWNRTMLLQYYYDFTREMAKGHNLIEEKYGRMMESTAPEEYAEISAGFPAINDRKRQIIENIVSMQVAWMEDFSRKYPHLAGNARSIHTYEDHLYNTSYETYLRGEISTYSDKMLELYGRYVVEYAKNDGNIARDIMEQSVLLYGYESLEEAERLQELM